MNKNLVIVCVLILAAGGAFAYYSGDPMFRAQQAPRFAGEEAPQGIDGASEGTPQGTPGDSIGKHAVSWKFETVAEAKDDGTPQKTKVTVTWDGTSHDAGTYEGSCAEIDGSNGSLSDGEVSGALCWFAGAGDEIGVFSENGAFVLKHGEQQEPSGEGEGFRGNFKTLLSL
jgi:hypothetical protein